MTRLLCCLLMISILSCDSDRTNRNPFLQEIGFRFDVNLNLPLYTPLTNIGNAVYIDAQGIGTSGVFVMKTSFDQYMAWEASCPNHIPNNCSTMELDSQTASCPCEGYKYSLFTGQQLERPDDGNRYYDLLFYRTSFSGNTIIISN